MNETEEFLRAAFAATADPPDAGFTRRVAARIDAVERRRSILLALLMTTGGLLMAAMTVGLFRLGHLWELLANQNWFFLPLTGSDLISTWASTLVFVLAAVITFPLVRSRM